MNAEELSLIVGLAGLVISGAGFTLAGWQLKRTADATVATSEAMMRSERRMALNHLLVLIPQFQLIELTLDRAVQENDNRQAIYALSSCHRISSELQGLLHSEKLHELTTDLPTNLNELSKLSSSAKNSLVGDTSLMNVKLATKDVRVLLRGYRGCFAWSGGFGCLC